MPRRTIEVTLDAHTSTSSHVTGAPDIAALESAVPEAAGSILHRRTVRTDVLEVDIFYEKHGLPSDTGDDFVALPYYLEVEAANESVTFDAFVAALASLLNRLRARGLRVVASCDFEDQLAAAMHG